MRQIGLPRSEAQRGSVTCPRSPFKKGSQRGLAVRAAWLWLPGRVDPQILHQGREDLWVSSGAQETRENICSPGVRVTGRCTAGLGKQGPPTRPQDCLLWPLRVLAGRGGTALPPRNKGASLPISISHREDRNLRSLTSCLALSGEGPPGGERGNLFNW